MHISMAFLMARTGLDEEGRVSSSELYDAYVKWHPPEGGKRVKRKTFINQATEAYRCFPVEYGIHRFPGLDRPTRGFKGVVLYHAAAGRELSRAMQAVNGVIDATLARRSDAAMQADFEVLKDLLMTVESNYWSRKTARKLLEEWAECYSELDIAISLLK